MLAVRSVFSIWGWATEGNVQIGNNGQSFSTNSADPGVSSPAYAVITPSVTTRVKLRLIAISTYNGTTVEVGQISIIQLTAQGPAGPTGTAGAAGAAGAAGTQGSTGPAGSITRAFNYYNAGAAVPKVTFNVGTAIDLRFNKVRGVIRAQLVAGQFNFPIMIFNNNHTYPTDGSSLTESNQIHYAAASTRPQSGLVGKVDYIWDINPNFAQFASVDDGYGTGGWFITTFEITLMYNRGLGTSRQLFCKGEYIISTKPIGTGAWQQSYGSYMRTSDIGGGVNLTHIGFGSYTQYSATNGISACECEIEIINSPSYTLQTTP